MIPTMMLFGVVLGRWWKTTLIAAAIFWPTLLLWGGVLQSAPNQQSLAISILLASALGAANAAVGIGVHQVALFVIRRLGPNTGTE